MSILIVGYSYIRDAHRRAFDYYPENNGVFFLLPKIWKARGGAVTFLAPVGDNIITADAYFSHSHYPLVGGLFKGLMPALPLVLWKSRKTKKINLIYSCSEPTLLTTLYNGFWAKSFGIKHVVFSWENIPYEKKFRGVKLFFKTLIIKLNLLLCNGLICGNKKGKEIYKKMTDKPISVIPLLGLDEKYFSKTDSNDKKINNINLKNKVVFTFAGAITYRKGINDILNVLNILKKSIPNFIIIFAGNNELGNIIQEYASKRSLTDNIIVLPWLSHSQLKDLLSVSDVFLYPSLSYKGWEEQFGYSMAEASLMKLPVISTKTGSIEDVIIDGETGMLIESGNESQLARAMIKLGTDELLRIRMGENGRRFIIQNFSNEIVGKKFYDFFDSL